MAGLRKIETAPPQLRPNMHPTKRLMAEPLELVDSELNPFNPNKPFNFSHASELPYGKSPSTIKHSAYAAFPATSSPATGTGSQKKRKIATFAANLSDDDYKQTPSKSARLNKKPSDQRSILPKTPIKRKRKTRGPPIQQRAIPRSFEECDPADKLLITLRDGGAEWDTIVKQWKDYTGETKVGKSTLPNRYNRLKENFSVIREEDNARLIESKREIEENFESNKWTKISNLIRGKGGDEYPAIVLQRQYKKLMLAVGARPPQGVRDLDFEVEPMPASPEPRESYYPRRSGGGGRAPAPAPARGSGGGKGKKFAYRRGSEDDDDDDDDEEEEEDYEEDEGEGEEDGDGEDGGNEDDEGGYEDAEGEWEED